MKKISIISLISIICLVLMASLAACGKGDILDKFEFKDYDSFKESTKNYSMTIVNGNETTVIKVADDSFLYDNGTSIYFYNSAEQKGYLLDKVAKTGVVNTYQNGEGLYDWEANSGIIEMLYSFQLFKLFMKQSGTEKVAGRDCTVYTYSQDGSKSRYWLDNELGMCLKAQTTESGETETMEITEFTLGGVTAANMIDLTQYTISDGGTTKTVQSIAVKSDTIPAGKTTDDFVLGDIKIIVYYDDSTNQEISLTASMLSSADSAKLDTAGTHSITVTYQSKTASFSVTLAESTKAVASVAIKSGTVPIGKTKDNFVLSDIILIVYYDDSTQKEIALAESMLSSADLAKLDTAGTHDITVTYRGQTAALTVTLADPAQSDSPIVESIEDFFANIVINSDTAANGFSTSLAFILGVDQPDFSNYYYESAEGRIDFDIWSAPVLLRDASNQIDAYLQDSFDTEEINFGGGVTRTPSCTATSEGYSVNYLQNKGQYSYWFETEIDYDDATQSLRAQIYCGIDDQRELKYIIEYNKNTDGNYACVIHFPDIMPEGAPQSYTSLKLYFLSVAGKLSINRLQPDELSESYLLYKKTDNASYADSGDAVISTDGTDVTCPVDNLRSGFYDDFEALFAALTSNREMIYDEDSEEVKDISYSIDSETLLYTIEDIYADSYSVYDIIKTYDNKRYFEVDEYSSLNTNRTGDMYVVTYENEYEEIIFTVKYDASGSFCIEKEIDGEIVLRFQWVQIGNAHFAELLTNDCGTYTQYKYTFDTAQNTMKFSCIYEMDESVNLNIYKATGLTAATFAPVPDADYYNHYSFQSGVLTYNNNFGD